jgi:YNFM family putative membrane transporter
MGRLMLRFGRSFVIRLTIVAMVLGTLCTLATPLTMIVAGVGLFTCGFFGLHSSASAWVSRRAQLHRAQATSLYLFCYYLGSSISGTVGGLFWDSLGWRGVSTMIFLLLLATVACTEQLQRSFNDPPAPGGGN